MLDSALQAQIDLLLSAMNVAGDAILVYQISGSELILQYANLAFYERSGYDPAEVLGKPLTWFRRGMPDDPGMQEVREALRFERAVKTEVCSYRRDGRSYWNQVTLQPIRDARGSIAHWISVERDVTDAVERESKLEYQNARLVALLNNARELFGSVDLKALKARYRRAMRDLTGDGRPATEFDKLVADLFEQYFEGASQNASLVAELEEQRNAVLELNQIKTDLIAMLAHDFKGPLTNILGYADLTAEVGDVNEHQREYLDAIRRAAWRLSDLATDTLSLSRLERNEIDLAHEDVDMRQLLREVVDANEAHEIEIDFRGDATVRGDARRLRQVFYNLIENAIKYSPNGAAVTVRIRTENNDVRVEVEDRGIGIPAAEQTRIFDRFSRASNARRLKIPGTGFGLFLARQIVEMHGGAIAVASVEGRGSTFTVTLPVSGASREERPLRVAVLEGKGESRSFVTHALREAGFRAHVLSSVDAMNDETFDSNRIVVDIDTLSLEDSERARLETFAARHGAALVVLGTDPPRFGKDAVILRKPYLMRDLVAAVQSGSANRSGAE